MKYIYILLFLLSLTIVTNAQEERKIIREGNEYYKTKDFEKSTLNYKKAYKINPESYNLLNNIGASQYRNGTFKESAMNYENFLKMTGSKKEKADAFYNIGNSYLQAADYKKSIEAYRNALRMDPEHDMSRYNMAVATKIKEQQQQQQQQDQEQGDGEDNQEQQDKKDGDENEDKSQGNEDQQNEDQKQDQQDQPQPKDNEMSREEMERFLESLQQQEKDVQDKVKKEKFKNQQRIVEKDW